MEDKPKLRPLEMFPAEMQGQKTICISDPEKLTDSVLFMTELGFYFISQMDGSHSVDDIKADFKNRFGEDIPAGQIEGLVQQLDEAFFLDNEKYTLKREAVFDEFNESDTRPSSHAGLSYPDDPADIKQMLDGFYEAASADTDTRKVSVDRVTGIIAPHIDVRRGGTCFAAAYQYLRDCKPDLFVILGVGHNASNNIFTVERRDYETPLGTAAVDRDSINMLASKLGDKIFQDAFIHRTEHSIEFQVLFLQHLLGADTPPILPVLCTSFHEMLMSGGEPRDNESVTGFIESMKETVGDKKVCYIAGVDLAHVGQKFGDATAPGDEQRAQINKEDIALLNKVESVDPRGFYKSVAKDHDARRICGLSAIYTFLEVSGATGGHLLKYEQMNDEATGSLVSYAGMVFS